MIFRTLSVFFIKQIQSHPKLWESQPLFSRFHSELIFCHKNLKKNLGCDFHSFGLIFTILKSKLAVFLYARGRNFGLCLNENTNAFDTSPHNEKEMSYLYICVIVEHKCTYRTTLIPSARVDFSMSDAERNRSLFSFINVKNLN